MAAQLPAVMAPVPKALLPQRVPPKLNPFPIPISLFIILLLGFLVLLHQKHEQKPVCCSIEDDVIGDSSESREHDLRNICITRELESTVPESGTEERSLAGLGVSDTVASVADLYPESTFKSHEDCMPPTPHFNDIYQIPTSDSVQRPESREVGTSIEDHRWEEHRMELHRGVELLQPAARGHATSCVPPDMTLREPSQYGGSLINYALVGTQVSEENMSYRYSYRYSGTEPHAR